MTALAFAAGFGIGVVVGVGIGWIMRRRFGCHSLTFLW